MASATSGSGSSVVSAGGSRSGHSQLDAIVATAAVITPLHPCSYAPLWYRQYVHASGVAFVRIASDGVHWLPNRLPLNRSQQALWNALAPWILRGRRGRAGAGDDSGGGGSGGGAADADTEADDVTLGKLQLYRAVAEVAQQLVGLAAAMAVGRH